ncbi:MAG: 30S ribosomal protein S21 [Bacilli bacterium]|nr:30S ribosomal protein S21 [Bacilli bacterium]
MSSIQVRNGNVEGALRTMKQKNARSGLLKELRERQEGYLKPGVKRRMAKEEAKRNSRRKERYDRAS